MTTGHEELGIEGERAHSGPLAPPRVRATSSSARVASSNQLDAATVTAELPAVGGRPRPARGFPEVGLLDGGRRWVAPVPLRFAVWVLFFGLLVAVTGAIVAARDPGWLAFLRNTAAVPTTSAGSSTPSSSAPAAAGVGKIALVSSNSAGATYSVPVNSYSVLLLTKTDCYLEIKSPPSAAGFVYAQVVAPGTKPTSVALQGAASVTLEAQASSLSISSQGRSLGTIADPKVAFTYTFRPGSA